MTTLRSVARRVIPLSVALATIVPAATSAQGQVITVQRAGGSGISTPRVNMTIKGSITRNDLAEFDPIQHFLSKKKDLKLDDTQQKLLSALEAPLKKTRDSLFKKIDSAQSRVVTLGDMQPTLDRSEQSRRDIDAMLIVLRQAYGQAANDALTLLTAEQRPKAQALLEKLSADMAQAPMGKASD
jgi:hypothetical protein